MAYQQSCGADSHQANVRVSITLRVDDAKELWMAAFVKGLANPEAGLDDIVAMIGSAQNPSIGECIALLAEPGPIAGCIRDDFRVEVLPSGPGRMAGVAPSLEAAPRRASIAVQ